MKCENNRIVPWSLIGYVVLAWCAGMGLLLVAQVFIGTNGLTVYPAGEDFTWLQFIQPPEGIKLSERYFSLHSAWWALASRNPLAPWWYWYISPLIIKFPESLYIARKVVELFLGISSLLVIYEALGRSRAWMAVWTAILVLAWNFSIYLEQVLFVMLISLVFSLFSIYFYLVYLHSARRKHGYLIASLVTFFIALGTYTIQCGVPLAIVLLGLINVLAQPTGQKLQALKNTLIDSLGYVCLFILFIQIWITTSGPTSEVFTLDINLFFQHIGTSIKYFLWHSNVNSLVRSILTNWNVVAVLLASVASLSLFLMLTRFRKMRIEYVSNSHKEYLRLLIPIAIVTAISVPTLLLESTSNMWAPGTRSEMLQQIFNPVVYMFSALFVIQLVRPYIKETSARILSSIIVVFLCSIATLISLEYNRKLFEQSQFEQRLMTELKAVLPTLDSPKTILVKVKDYDWYDGHHPVITDFLIRQAFGTIQIRMQTIGTTSSVTKEDPIIFGSKEKGVHVPGVLRQKEWVPYADLIVVEAEKNRAKVIKNFSPEQLQFDTVQISNDAPKSNRA